MTTTTKYTITDIKSINAAYGQHFFDPSTLRFFRSKILPAVYQGPGGVYFVTSEQFVGSDGRAAARKFTVRKFVPETGGCSTVGKFNEIRNIEDARGMAKEYARVVASVGVAG